jgi:hypothetical protein
VIDDREQAIARMAERQISLVFKQHKVLLFHPRRRRLTLSASLQPQELSDTLPYS